MPNCTYCGAWDGDSRDHVVPVSFNRNVNRAGRSSVSYSGTVDCCRECNSLLGAVPCHTVPTRAAYLLAAIERRYKKLLREPDYTEEELEEYGPGIRASIIQSTKDKSEIRRRLEHLAIVASG